MSSAQPRLPILISVFNHKGGIGKTTAVYNMGFILHQLGKRVLLVDADPQASLTSLVYAARWQENPDLQQEFYEDAIRLREEHNRYKTVADIFHPTIRERRKQVPDLARAARTQITQIHEYQNLFMIPGHLDTGKLDQPAELGLGGIGFYTDIPETCTRIFRRIGELNKIDIVLFDLAPSVGGWNRSIIMFSDYICTPFFADYLSYQAVRSLFEQLTGSWLQQFQITQIGLEAPPKFLGAYPQRVRTRKGVLEQSYGKWIRQIYQRVAAATPDLRTRGAVTDRFQLMRIFGVHDFVSVGLDVQASGHPISDLVFDHMHPESDGKIRRLKQTEKDRKEEAHNTYRKIVGVLFNHISPEHRTLLGDDFMREIDIATTTREQFYFSDRTEEESIGSEPKSPLKSDSEDEGEERFWYNNNHILQLLRHYLGYERDILGPLQGDDLFADRGQLVETLNDYYTSLQDADIQTRTTYLPLNLGRNHWVLIVIDLRPQLAQVYYYDPLGAAPYDQLRERLSIVFGLINRQLVMRNYGQHNQQKSYNCGPWIIEFARRRAIAGHQFPPQDIAERRQEHLQVLGQLGTVRRSQRLLDRTGGRSAFFRPPAGAAAAAAGMESAVAAGTRRSRSPGPAPADQDPGAGTGDQAPSAQRPR